jgi:hypothetical protein
MIARRLVAAFALVSIASLSALAGCAASAASSDDVASTTSAAAPLTLRFADPVTIDALAATISNVVVVRAADGAVSVSWHVSTASHEIDANVARTADGKLSSDAGADAVHALFAAKDHGPIAVDPSALQTDGILACAKSLRALGVALLIGTAQDISTAAVGVTAACNN